MSGTAWRDGSRKEGERLKSSGYVKAGISTCTSVIGYRQEETLQSRLHFFCRLMCPVQGLVITPAAAIEITSTACASCGLRT